MQRENSSSGSSIVCSITPFRLYDLHETLFAIFLGILFPMTVTSNSLLILALRKTNQLNTYSNKFIQVMSFCDLATGLIFQPALIVLFFMKENKTICYLMSIINFATLIMCETSALLSILISIDRYLQVTKLNRYNIYMNGTRMKVSIGLCFVFGVFFSCFYAFHKSFVTQALISLAWISLISFVFALYSFISHKLQKHCRRRSTRNQTDPTGPGPNPRSHLSTIKTLRLLQVTMLVLYTPFLGLSILWNYYNLHLQVSPPQIWTEVFNWTHILVECNAWVNACILIQGNSRCRRFLVSLIRNGLHTFWNRNSVAALVVSEIRQGHQAHIKER